jgi:hypothetical protein
VKKTLSNHVFKQSCLNRKKIEIFFDNTGDVLKMPVDLFSPLICRESRWRENAAYLVTSIANLYQGIYSETGFHYGVERNFI